VEDGYVIFLDGYSIKKASRLKRFMETASNIMKGDDAKNLTSWKKDITIKRISEM
jgi:hypothetical protein